MVEPVMFECEYCETKFLTEEQFGKHVCRERERTMYLETNPGRAAYNYYTAWFKEKKLFTPRKETYIASRYYNPFITFTAFVKNMGIPDTKIYIKLMVDRGVLPEHWYHADIYDLFIDHLDNDCPMKVHTRITLTTVDRIAGAFGCNMNEVFKNLNTSDMVKLINTRNLSPWALMLSHVFKEFLTSHASNGASQVIEDAINLNKWKLIIDRNRVHIPETKAILSQLGL